MAGSGAARFVWGHFRKAVCFVNALLMSIPKLPAAEHHFGLPIEEVVGEIRSALRDRMSLVVVAPPGAGKTTRLPLVFRDEPWCAGQRLILVEPRRLAARAAAERMAALLGEEVGETVGLRARLDTRIGPNTTIEVVTEGVFSRMILADPALDGVAAVLFDEFHERALEADFGLALALDAQAGLRDDLRLVVMSATLDGARVAKLLPGGEVVESAGRSFDIETRYVGRARHGPIEAHVAETVLRALERDDGDVLVFLPGQREIVRVVERLEAELSPGGRGHPERDGEKIDVLPLYGALTPQQQKRAIRPRAAQDAGPRRVIVSSAIAESALTIGGVRIVVDAGLSRVPRFDAASGVTRLETVRASVASADQRRGRAGRTAPGVCYRLWDEPETRALPPFDQPEILSSDLTGLVLDCAEWGVTSAGALSWLDPPPDGLWHAAVEGLSAAGAIDGERRITSEGRLIRQLPVPPRLAAMLLNAARADLVMAREGDVGPSGLAKLAGEITILLVERGAGGASVDLVERLQRFRQQDGPRAKGLAALAQRFSRKARELVDQANGANRALDEPGVRAVVEAMGGGVLKAPADRVAALLLMAFPDRLAMARRTPSPGGDRAAYLLAGGRASEIAATDPLAREPFLVVADLQGQAKAARILLAAKAGRHVIDAVLRDTMTRGLEVVFDDAVGAVVGRETLRLGALTLQSSPAPLPDDGSTAQVLADAAVRRGIARLPWSKAQQQLRARAAFVAAAGASAAQGVPDLSNEALAQAADVWLQPFLNGLSRLDEIDAATLQAGLDVLVPYEARRQLDAAAPTHFEAPTGSRIAIDYEGASAPAIDVRVQELFGLDRHPTVANGQLPLTLRLLSPARRPIQVTRDLPGFWAGSWADVKAEMKGRYPKHPWPDAPAEAQPTTRAKPRR